MKFSTTAAHQRRDAQHRGASLLRATLFVLGVLCTLASVKPALAVDGRITWRAVPQAAGYRLFVRPQGQNWGPGADVGLPPADQLGVIAYVTHAIKAGMVNEIAVSAYDASGQQSPKSNIIALMVPSNTPTATRTYTPSPTRTATATRPPATKTATRPPATATRTSTPQPTRTFTPTYTPSSVPTPTGTRPRGRVKGRVQYYRTGVGVPQTNVGLIGNEPWQSGTTSEDGSFQIEGTLDATWLLVADKRGDAGDAVSALDAAYILQAAAGLRQLDPVQTVACDASGNGTLSTLDAAQVLQFAVGARASLPASDACGSDWVFVPDVSGAGAQMPHMDGACSRGLIHLDPLSGDVNEQNFIASVIGDCTGNWAPRAAAARDEAQAALRGGAPPPVARLRERATSAPYRYVVELEVGDVATLQALEAQIVYDPYAATLVEARALNAARSSLLRDQDDGSGLVSLALATGEAITPGTAPLIQLVFQTAESGAAPYVLLAATRVDDVYATVE